MPFRWLPDSELYAHPRLSWALECAFDIVVGAMYRKVVLFPNRFHLAPGTLITSNHQRDSDAPILATTLCWRDGLRLRGTLPFFATREDLFERHALASLLGDRPRLLARLLGLIPLDWFFRNVRARPMRRVREFSFGETLRALLAAGQGGIDPRQLFNARGRRELREQIGDLPPRLDAIDEWDLGPRRLAHWGLRRLRLDALRMLEPEFRRTVVAQLQHFAALLDAGHMLYFAPEGCVSLNGEFGRIRAGTRRLCQLTSPSAPVLPFALSYDPLGPGRQRVIVRVGEPACDGDPAESARFAVDLRRAIRKLCSVTPSHLLAHYLRTGPPRFDTTECSEWMGEATDVVGLAGFSLDPLLMHTSPPALVAPRLRWLRRKGLLQREGGQWRNCWPRDSQPGWGTPAQMVAYLGNAFVDLAPTAARKLAA